MIAPSSGVDKINAVERKQDSTEAIGPGEKEDQRDHQHRIRRECDEARPKVAPRKISTLQNAFASSTRTVTTSARMCDGDPSPVLSTWRKITRRIA